MSNNPSFKYGDKIKLIKDHNNKPLTRPKYGYVVCVIECEKSPDGIFVEYGMKKDGYAYLIQTSWSGGALWYSEAAFKPAAGKNELNAWKDKIDRWNASHP
jgi:hypothetical protein